MSSSAITSIGNAAKAAVDTVTGGAQSDEPQGSTDESGVISSQDTEARRKLERQLSNRPDRSELVEKNILKYPNVAPGLQAAQAELAKAQLEDKLEASLQKRPSPEDLVKEGILNADEVPGA